MTQQRFGERANMAARLFLRRYKVIRLLGQGGMGCVYLASQSNSDRLVVVKTLHEKLASDAHYRSIFQQEIDCLSRFRHPYAVELYEASMDGPDGPCAVMEYVDGQPLDAVLARDGPFTVARIGQLLGRLCAVLQSAHDLGIVHRDLKPANIMVVGVGTAQESLKVLDFGLARQIGDPTRGLYLPLEKFVGSRVHKAVGTPEYACPEQFRGDEVDHRGDLYSVGVILFELLTGRRPFQRTMSAELVEDHLHATPPPLSAHGVHDAPPALETLVHACLAKNPADRPQSARELALSYSEVLGSSIWDEGEARARDPVPAAGSTNETGDPDENVEVFRLEAWMPESIAAMKLRGFVDDHGEVSTSVPGRLRVRLRMPRPIVASPRPSGFIARLRLGRTAPPPPAFELVDADVFVEAKEASRPSELLITMRLHPPKIQSKEEALRWHDWCKQIEVDLAAYLMARKVG
jgi:serine/threonine protein kinase